ncbi:MAG TPA: virulence RhuM family protein [Kiritimatiellia bacterium]|nr:virulence RhuM family protein [Kiritimatiellia bacterium]
MKPGELIVYRSEDGKAEVQLAAADGSVWLSQGAMAELFGTSVPNINIHIRNILKENELPVDSVVKQSLTTAADGKKYRTKRYRLEMILAVGYRVRSPRGTEFRQWATRHLAEYLVKGFVMDDERLKNPGGWDYFDELLARIREIRASEKRFYQKVRDLFALSADYEPGDREAQLFFAETQNKLLFAVTGKTAAEIVVARADPKAPNMALTSWSGSRVRKHDVWVAKNYLTADEVDTLNRLVVIFLEQAELRVKERKPLTMDYWRENVVRLLEFNGKAVLGHAGSVTHDDMQRIAGERYEQFDEQRRLAEAKQADAEEIEELARIEKQLEKGARKKPMVNKVGTPRRGVREKQSNPDAGGAASLPEK